MPIRTLSRRAAAPAVAVALTAGLLAPAASAAPAAPAPAAPAPAAPEKPQMATGPGSTEFTQAEVDNALRFLALLFGIGAILVTIGTAVVHFAGPHLGIKLPF